MQQAEEQRIVETNKAENGNDEKKQNAAKVQLIQCVHVNGLLVN